MSAKPEKTFPNKLRNQTCFSIALIQSIRITQRQFRVDALHRHAHGLKRISGGLNHQCHVVPAFLAIRDKEQWLRVTFLKLLHHIGGDADDRNPAGWLVLVIEETEALPNRVLAGPQAGRSVACENSGFVMSAAIDFIEVTTAQERQMDGIEIARRLRDERDPGTLSWVRNWGMLKLNLLASGT